MRSVVPRFYKVNCSVLYKSIGSHSTNEDNLGGNIPSEGKPFKVIELQLEREIKRKYKDLLIEYHIELENKDGV